MPLPVKPTPSASVRILSNTLCEVRRQRRRRQQFTAAAAAALVTVAGISALWSVLPSSSSHPLTEPARSNPSAQPVAEAKIAPAPAIVIERITAKPESRSNSRIQRSSHLGNMELLSVTTDSPHLIETISARQLFASLPESQPAALVKNPDGSSRLFLFQDSRRKH